MPGDEVPNGTREFITETLSRAALLAKEMRGATPLDIDKGDHNQIVTAADQAVGALVLAAVSEAFSDHNVIDEEAGVISKKSRYTWLIDPIDGTSNYAAGSPCYAVMVGLLDGATPVAGGIAVPEFDTMVVAARGEGTWRNGRQLPLLDGAALDASLIAYLIDGHREAPERTYREGALLAALALACRNLRTSGSYVDAVLVAEGAYGAVINQTSKVWDSVPAHIVVEEVGGKFTQVDGSPIDYSGVVDDPLRNFTCCAAHPAIHAEIQEIVTAWSDRGTEAGI